MIKLLPPEVQGHLRSGVAIPSLQQCVEELVLNSIDAGATCVGVRMDLEAFKVQVIDNGAGMNAEDMERVGTRYHTSKCGSLEDLDNIKSHGFRGEALASIVSMATLVEISSRPRASAKTHVKLFKDGRGVDVFEAETDRPSAGTTVIICNFFHNMPVRRRRLDPVLEGERIRHRVEAVSLMHPSVSFTLKNDSTGAMMVQLPKAKSTYHRFLQIHGLTRAEKLGEISHTYKQFEAVGYLGKEGHYNNSLQFLYVNERLLLKTRIHKLLNLLLRRLRQKPDTSDGPPVLKSPKNKQTHELFGVYILNIKCSYSEYDICFEPAKTLIEFKDWEEVLLCVEEAVKAFLRRENLTSEFSQEDLDFVSPKVFGPSRADQEVDQTRAAPPDISTMDCSVGMKLASEFVHRRRTDGGACPEPGLTKNKTEETEESGQTGASVDESQTTTQVESEGSGGVKNAKMPNEHEWELSEDVRQSGSSTCSFSQLVSNDLNCSKCIINIHNTGRPQQSLESNRKISLSEPVIHNILQIPKQSQTNKVTFPEQRLEKNSQDKYIAPKRKISLNTAPDRSTENPHRDLSSNPPTKISRIFPCQKPSVFKESGSLDRFRRMYAQSGEMKLPRQHQQKGPQTSSRVIISSSLSFCNNDLKEPKTTEAQGDEEKQSSSLNPPCFSTVKTTNKNKLSFSAKLSQLKEKRKEDAEVSLHASSSMLEKNICNKGTEEDSTSQNPPNTAVYAGSSPRHRTSPHQTGNEEDSASSVWLHHYNTYVGQTVYVNRMTGLSRYDNPAEETQVPCTSDVTNMAVSVFSETGMEYRCYPFQLAVVLPFLPKSRSERLISSGLDCGDAATESSNSLSVMYSKWKNPVFVQPPEVGVDISGGQADGLVVKIHSVLFPYRLSKAMIHSMKVIDQVDKKFLACLINTSEEELTLEGETEGNLLVLVDQHAAHERVRLENLITDSYEDIPETFGEKWLCSSSIVPPLEISVTEEELRLLSSCRSQLRSLGLEVTFSETQMSSVFVGKVPRCFLEKETNELKRGRPSIIKTIVEEFLQEQIELLLSTGRVKGTLPITVLKVLASLACHGAVKFNDVLNRDECHSLVASLSSCQLPFQCAHGRPSIAPLVDINHLDEDPKDVQKPNLKKLRRMYEEWKLRGNI
ncbi:DNA mismatch repair protein Mlh3 isoform X2 [Oryzias melastigma]|uniref:DNA mismatch repair protein Mlh3 isoform X2 n=1 Tax=Oryzias melastigma TaxID=30732 RepID=UPI000CF81A01|nr:DNA mismatch repair protein Mlh3 isoform X2 [Oryzias melastigma]